MRMDFPQTWYQAEQIIHKILDHKRGVVVVVNLGQHINEGTNLLEFKKKITSLVLKMQELARMTNSPLDGHRINNTVIWR